VSSITRHTHILGFSTPVVNGGDVCVPVRGPRGLFHFVAPPLRLERSHGLPLAHCLTADLFKLSREIIPKPLEALFDFAV